MTTVHYVIALLRSALLACPLLVAGHLVRTRFSSLRGAPAVVLEATLALAWLLVVAELLGLVGGLRLGWLAAAVWAAAGVCVLALRPRPRRTAPQADPARTAAPRPSRPTGMLAAVVMIWLAVAQWALATVDALGGGMFSFDVLWYHMPFAAAFAHTGSVTAIQFTQADPFVAYYPATAELFHALGIVAWRNDFLSPLLNLGWMALALLAAWCAGQRWGVQWLTLAAGALLVSLPVLSTTQPGEAFNDIVGLAALMLAVALILTPGRDWLELLATGLALGLAAGTKYTFLVPGVVLIVGVVAAAEPRERRRAGGLLVGGLAITGGWWYLRALVQTGNPLGLSQSLGPLHLPGPSSPLASASQQTVFSEIRHLSLWGSRFAPGLAHAFGPLWPLILVAAVAVVIAAVTLRGEPLLRVLAVAADVAAVTYLFLPTGATGIQQSTTDFQVNLRYVTPALALCLLLLPAVLATRAPAPARRTGRGDDRHRVARPVRAQPLAHQPQPACRASSPHRTRARGRGGRPALVVDSVRRRWPAWASSPRSSSSPPATWPSATTSTAATSSAPSRPRADSAPSTGGRSRSGTPASPSTGRSSSTRSTAPPTPTSWTT
jgi:hypothetical protein